MGNCVSVGASVPTESYEISFLKWRDDLERDSVVDAVIHGSIITKTSRDLKI